jgi:hypothetical protein
MKFAGFIEGIITMVEIVSQPFIRQAFLLSPLTAEEEALLDREREQLGQRMQREIEQDVFKGLPS